MPMAFTWEIYGNMTADFHDCFRMFNPVRGRRSHISEGVHISDHE